MDDTAKEDQIKTTSEEEVAVSTEQPAEAPKIHDRIRYTAGTDIGKRREENQDSFRVIEGTGKKIFIVADGMGGVKGGAIASNLAIESVEAALKDIEPLTPADLVQAVESANKAVFDRGNTEPGLAGMGTTFVSLCFLGEDLHVVSVGDSRAYLIRNDTITQLTEDHTLVTELLRNGAISSDQAEHHPISHMLTRSLGPTATVEVDCLPFRDGVRLGDHFLLCSDGLYNLVTNAEMKQLVRSKSLDEALQGLIQLANERGGTDNITIILVRVEGEGDATRAPRIADTLELDDDLINQLRADVQEGVDDELIEIGDDFEPSTGEGGSRKVSSEQSRIDTEKTEIYPRGVTLAQYLGFGVVVIVIAAFAGAVGGWYFGGGANRNNQISHTDPTINISNPDTAPDVIVPDIGLGEGQVIDITKRKLRLRSELKSLERRLASLGAAPGTNEAIDEEALNKRQATLTKEIDEYSNQIAVATRKASIWQGRRDKFNSEDPLALAQDLAALSDIIRTRREAAVNSTYAYLKEKEILDYDPSDAEQNDVVREALRDRSAKLRGLGDAIAGLIEIEMSSALKELATASEKKDRAQLELKNLREELNSLTIALGEDTEGKEKAKRKIIEEIDLAKAELGELEQLLPKDKERL